jgi:hypothetical protein
MIQNRKGSVGEGSVLEFCYGLIIYCQYDHHFKKELIFCKVFHILIFLNDKITEKTYG